MGTHEPIERIIELSGVEMIQRDSQRVETEPWSRPEMFWDVRVDRRVRGPGAVLTPFEKAWAALRVARRFGVAGIRKAVENERELYRAVLDGKLGYALYWGRRPVGLGGVPARG
jgi:hypothetical protein